MSVFDRIKAQVGNQENFDIDKAKEDVKRWREEDESKQMAHYKKQFDDARANDSMGRSGILELHLSCRVDNYIANTADQNKVKDFARHYVDNFHLNNGSGFIFSGSAGTGKNHLAAAICLELMDMNYSCMVATVNELMQKLRNTYQRDSKITEDEFIRTIINFDLLVIDEIGLQRGTDAEKLAINQIVDGRMCRMKPTGMLTNLDAQEINEVLGVRVMDRMRNNNGKWLQFNWDSHRG